MSVNKYMIEFFYDALSPYTYLAFELLSRCNKKWNNIDLQMKPVLIAGIMQAAKNKPPGMVAMRAQYLGKDLVRLSKYYDIPFELPNDVMHVMLSKGSMKAQRLLTAVKREIPESLEDVSRQVMLRIWVKDQDITEDESLLEACIAAGLTKDVAKKLVGMTRQDDVKEALKNETAAATGYGAFGLPTYVLHKDGKKEMLFGTDRLFLLAHYVGHSWPVSKL